MGLRDVVEHVLNGMEDGGTDRGRYSEINRWYLKRYAPTYSIEEGDEGFAVREHRDGVPSPEPESVHETRPEAEKRVSFLIWADAHQDDP